jgi:hypothetical protein
MKLVEKLTPFKIITEAEAENHFSLLNYIKQGFGDTCKYILLEGNGVITGDIDTCQLCMETETYGIKRNLKTTCPPFTGKSAGNKKSGSGFSAIYCR